jgi:hypothetical protein
VTISPVSVCMSVYGQPEMLAHNLRTIAAYPDEVLDQLTVLIADDCGEPEVDEAFCRQFPEISLHVWRILENVSWNQMGGRNLAMHHADPHWCLMIDPDMVFDAPMMRKIMETATKMRRRHVLKYGLRHVGDPDRPIDMTSPNTYLIHRDDFFAAGGYDEDYAGHKGWSDVQMLDVLKEHYTLEHRRDIFADFYSTAQIRDAAVHDLDRKTAFNKKVRIRKFEQAKAAGGWVKWVKKHKGPNLREPWIQVFPPL